MIPPSLTRSRLPCLFLVAALVCLGAIRLPAADATPRHRPEVFTESSADRAARVRGLGSEIETIYREHAEREHTPGVAWGVVLDGELVLSGGCGFADLEQRVPATPRSVFRIASMTKSFTAMSVLRLRDAGRLDLDRPVSRHLPEFRRLRGLTADSPAITPRHLLTHSAGFPEDNPWGDRQLADTEEQLVNLVRGPVQFSNAPGVEYEYSNLGFALLGRLVGRVSGRSCQRYIDTTILRPLGMTSTYWDFRKVPAGALAHGYRWQNGRWLEETPLGDGSFASMGGLLTTIEDFARYMALHLSAWPPRDDPDNGPLQRASLREMQQPWRWSGLNAGAKTGDGTACPTTSAYGYGLRWTADCEQRVRIGHTGGLPGFGSEWRILPEYGFGVVSFGNVTYAGVSRANTRVIELLLGRGHLESRELPASDILQRRAVELRRLLPDWEGAEQSGILAENFLPDHPIDALRERSRELFGRIGPISGMAAVEAENQLRGRFRLRGSRGAVEVFFTLTPENPPRVQELELTPIEDTSR